MRILIWNGSSECDNICSATVTNWNMINIHRCKMWTDVIKASGKYIEQKEMITERDINS